MNTTVRKMEHGDEKQGQKGEDGLFSDPPNVQPVTTPGRLGGACSGLAGRSGGAAGPAQGHETSLLAELRRWGRQKPKPAENRPESPAE